MAGANDPRLHHTVPACLSKHFVAPNGMLFGVRTGSGAIFSSSPLQLFRRRDLYAAVRSDGSRDTALEIEFSRIESRAAPVIQSLLRASRDSTKPAEFSAAEKSAFDHFFYAQFTRTPEFNKRFDFDSDFEIKLVEFVERDLKLGVLSPEQARDILTPESKAVIKKNARVNALGRPAPMTASATAFFGLEVLGLRDCDETFCLGSWPVVSFNGRPFDGKPDWRSQMWLPLAPDVAVRYAMPSGQISFRWTSDVESARRFNRMLWRQCEIVASPHKNLLVNLASAMLSQSKSQGSDE